MKVAHSIVIQRPVAEVYAFIVNLANERRWQPEIESVQLDKPGPLTVGSRFREARRTFGRRYEWYFEVTELEPNHTFTIRSLTGQPPYQGSRRFEAVPGGTRLTESGELQTRGLLKLLDPLFERLSRKPLAEAYARLKALLENSPAA
jgi:uncharacterized membrane protein